MQTLIAANRIGAIFVPLNYRLAPSELSFILADCDPHTVLVDGPRQAGFDELRQSISVRRYLGVEGAGPGWESVEQLIEQGRALDEPAMVGDDDVAIVMYTSGTTGKPKGVMLSNANLWWCAQSLMLLYDVHADDVTLAVSPLFHIAGLNVTIPTTWLKGGTVLLHRAFDARAFFDDIQRYRVNTLFGVPAMFLAMMALPDFADGDVSSCRLAICGGAPVPDHVLRTLSERGIPMLQGYGLTETAPVAIFLVAEHSLTKIGSCGFPAMYVESRLVDQEGEPIGRDRPGVPGEVQLRGPNVSIGYWDNPEATAAAYDDDGWFHTGDVGQYDEDGFCYIVDRLKDMIISGGENVYPAEVENVLFDHPSVAEAAVVGLPHQRWGEAVTAVVVPKPGHEVTLEQLRDFCATRLARYKLPLRLEVVAALPRNPAGKVLKGDLRHELTH